MTETANRAVLVTGSGTGLGLETALLLAAQGFRVYAGVLHDGQRPQVEAAAAERGVPLRVVEINITDETSIRAAVDTIVTEAGGIFGLVNNAGTRLRGCFEDLTDPEIRRLFDINVFGTMAVTRGVLPVMRKARQGRIVMITSVAGRIGSFGVGAYCATKFAQEGFGESLAQEVAPFGIRVVLIEPAIIRTEAWSMHRVTGAHALDPGSPYASWFERAEGLADAMVRSSPTRPQEVAQAVCDALTAKAPPLRRVVGRRARLVVALRRYVPDRLFERVYFGQVLKRIVGRAPQRPALDSAHTRVAER